MSRDELRQEWGGIPFATPVPRWMADLAVWQRFQEPAFAQYSSAMLNPVEEHLYRAVRDLYSPAQVRIHRWFQDCCRAFTHHDSIALLGAASSGKSFSMGVLSYLFYLADFGNCFVLMVSTSKEALLKRSMASAIEAHNMLRANGVPVPCKFVSQKCAIVPANAQDDLQGVKSMIQGVAITEGTEVDARGAVIGVHLPRVISICDELENMGSRAKVFLSAQANARAGTVQYKQVVAFNPQDINAPGCVLATPDRDGGWAALNPDQDTVWDTKGGVHVVRFDGRKSPGLDDPALTFLPTREFLADNLKACADNPDHPDMWSMVYGFPVVSQQGMTVLSNAELIYHKAFEETKWRGDEAVTTVAGFDPAFTADGDDAVLQIADVGHAESGALVVQFRDPIVMKIEATSKIPVSYQLVGQLKAAQQVAGFKLMHLAIDDSGTQNVADIVAKEMGTGFYRANFGTKASELPVSSTNLKPANRVYGNLVSELWGVLAEYVRFGHCRRLNGVAAQELTTRKFDLRRNPKVLETKREYKKRSGRRSPDHGDACALCGAVLRFVLGVRPGASMIEPWGFTAAPAAVNYARIKEINNLKSSYGVS